MRGAAQGVGGALPGAEWVSTGNSRASLHRSDSSAKRTSALLRLKGMEVGHLQADPRFHVN